MNLTQDRKHKEMDVNHRPTFRSRLTLLGMLAITLAGCAQVTSVQNTFALRDVQQQFTQAVQVDNAASVDPFVAGQSEGLYSAVVAALSDAQIAALNSQLQANAWLMRAVSEWRSMHPAQAITAAEKGLAVPTLVPQSRDQVLLALLPALVIDSELRMRLAQEAEAVSVEHYEDADGYRHNFETALDTISAAHALAGTATPPNVGYYLEYQRWRVLSNWRFVINRLATREARKTAFDAAATYLQVADIQAAAETAANAIPDGEPLRQLLRNQ
jgi:hypothetical protein